MKVVLVGGHLAPALALIEKLEKDNQIVFFGRKYAHEGDQTESLEYKEVTGRGIPFKVLSTARVQRSFTRQTLPSLSKLPIGFYQAFNYLRQEKPDIVLSFGGYLSVPVGYAAKLLSIPLVIHEQTLEAGLANKLLGKVADKICISWEPSRAYFPASKTVLTGNPLKKFSESKFAIVFPKNAQNLPLIYITGGSTGSHAINKLIEETVAGLIKNYRIIHQTGDSGEFKDFDRLGELKNSLPNDERERYILQKFIAPQEVGSIMQEASLIVSRSGINTVSELLYFGKPAILIPLPYGQRQEQLKNAQFIKEQGLAETLIQDQATPEHFLELVQKMVKHQDQYLAHKDEARSLLHTNAAEKILETMTYVVRKKSS